MDFVRDTYFKIIYFLVLVLVKVKLALGVFWFWVGVFGTSSKFVNSVLVLSFPAAAAAAAGDASVLERLGSFLPVTSTCAGG